MAVQKNQTTSPVAAGPEVSNVQAHQSGGADAAHGRGADDSAELSVARAASTPHEPDSVG